MSTLPNRSEIVSFLDQELATAEVPDRYSTNGLQVEGTQTVEKVGFCVDACWETFQHLSDCQLIVVHHGLFWPSVNRITGALRRSLGFLLERDISLYCSHLPLDVHPRLGNNAQLLKQLGFTQTDRFGQVGWLGEARAQPKAEFVARCREILGPVRLLDFGPNEISRIAVSSGGGSIDMLDEAKAVGAQLVLTGEASHPVYHACQEAEMNLILGGHYATETWGVRALMPLLAQSFSVDTKFVDLPTGF